jgi:hypothetical protein
VTRAEGPLQAGSMDADDMADPTLRGSLGRAGRGSAGSSPSSRPHTDVQQADPAGKAKLHQTLDPEPLAVIRGPAPRPEADRGLCQRVSALGMHQLQALGHKVTLQPAA